MKSFLKTTKYIVISLLIAGAISMLAMAAVYALPVGRMRIHVVQSTALFEEESDSYLWAPGVLSSRLDNYTDAIMLNTAIYKSDENPFVAGMKNCYVMLPGTTSMGDNLIQCAYEDVDYSSATTTDYARYWHGYLVWLKPMLLFFTVPEIRILCMCLQFILMSLVILEGYRTAGYRLALPLILMCIVLNPVSCALSFQYASVFWVIMVSIWLMLRLKLYEQEQYWKVFFWTGIATSFLDLLTYPIAGLGINLVLLIVLGNRKLKEQLLAILRSSVIWGIGYVGMWAMKWILASIIARENVIANAIEQILYRSGGSYEDITGQTSVWFVFGNNIKQLMNLPLTVVLGAGLVSYVLFVLIKKMQWKVNSAQLVTLLLVALYPFGWYLVVQNHSAIHSYMTHRDLVITVFAIACLLGFSISKRRENE